LNRQLVIANGADRRRSDANDREVASIDVALGYIDLILSHASAATLTGVPTSRQPNVCDIETRETRCRCQQCERTTRRLYLYADRLVLCRECASSRARVRHRLEVSA
jgi:Zn finger protein HypA/HybF involved in hydrogenase expression